MCKRERESGRVFEKVCCYVLDKTEKNIQECVVRVTEIKREKVRLSAWCVHGRQMREYCSV